MSWWEVASYFVPTTITACLIKAIHLRLRKKNDMRPGTASSMRCVAFPDLKSDWAISHFEERLTTDGQWGAFFSKDNAESGVNP